MKAANMIQLCRKRCMYNMIDEETDKSLWSRLETLYMTKSLFNKLYLKKQLYRLCMKEETTVLEHLNFNKIMSELLAVDVKIDEEDKALILFSLLPESCAHIIITMLNSKETLILEEVTSTLTRSGKRQIKKSRNVHVW